MRANNKSEEREETTRDIASEFSLRRSPLSDSLEEVNSKVETKNNIIKK